MKQAMAPQSWKLRNKIFDQFESLNLQNPVEILKLIDEMPKGEADGHFEIAKTAAREQLRKMVNPAPVKK